MGQQASRLPAAQMPQQLSQDAATQPHESDASYKLSPKPVLSRINGRRTPPVVSTRERLSAFVSVLKGDVGSPLKDVELFQSTSPTVSVASLRVLLACLLEGVADVSANAAATQEHLLSRKAEIVASAGATCETVDPIAALLEDEIEAVRAAKTSAIEAEAVVVEAALAALSFACDDACVVAADLTATDEILEATMMRLQAVSAQAAAIPRHRVEPSIIELYSAPVASDDAAALSVLGTLFSPRGVHARDVVMLPVPGFARVGGILCFELKLSGSYSNHALDIAMDSLACLTDVAAAFVEEGAELCEQSEVLQASCSRVGSSNIVRVSIPLPSPASVGSICISRVTVAGVLLEYGWPATVRVVYGLLPPLSLGSVSKTNFLTPCILPDGSLGLPVANTGSLEVYGADGALLFCVSHISGLSKNLRACAFDQSTETLLISDSENADSHLCAYALSPAGALSQKWVSANINACLGFAIALGKGVVIAGSFYDDRVYVHRLSDGERLETKTDVRNPTYMVGDAWGTPGTVYMGCADVSGSNMYCVKPCQYDSVSGLKIGPKIPSLVDQDMSPPLAIVPPTPGRRCAHLVVGVKGSDTLRVVSLPDHRLVHTHTLHGMHVTGLASDTTSGHVLIVCDSSAGSAGKAHVLAWPLPGMPELE